MRHLALTYAPILGVLLDVAQRLLDDAGVARAGVALQSVAEEGFGVAAVAQLVEAAADLVHRFFHLRRLGMAVDHLLELANRRRIFLLLEVAVAVHELRLRRARVLRILRQELTKQSACFL